MTQPFDSIIACGDSFTEGCQSELKISVRQTWPGLVAEHFFVPVVNLGQGGASNYEIALQPLQAAASRLWPTNLHRPLILFTFTHDYRMPYYDFDLGKINSLFTIDVERIKGISRFSDVLVPALNQGLDDVENRYAVSSRIKEKIDGYQHQTHAAINLANSLAKLMPQAKVLWGFGHCLYSDLEYDVRRDLNDRKKLHRQHYRHLDTCYNEDLPLRRPLQWISDQHQLWISKTDIHPNRKGIEAYARAMIEIIDRRFGTDHDK